MTCLQLTKRTKLQRWNTRSKSWSRHWLTARRTTSPSLSSWTRPTCLLPSLRRFSSRASTLTARPVVSTSVWHVSSQTLYWRQVLDTDPEVGKKFLEEKVLAIGRKYNCDNLYTYLTCALDRDLVKRVFESVRDHLVTTLINTNFGFD